MLNRTVQHHCAHHQHKPDHRIQAMLQGDDLNPVKKPQHAVWGGIGNEHDQDHEPRRDGSDLIIPAKPECRLRDQQNRDGNRQGHGDKINAQGQPDQAAQLIVFAPVLRDYAKAQHRLPGFEFHHFTEQPDIGHKQHHHAKISRAKGPQDDGIGAKIQQAECHSATHDQAGIVQKTAVDALMVHRGSEWVMRRKPSIQRGF